MVPSTSKNNLWNERLLYSFLPLRFEGLMLVLSEGTNNIILLLCYKHPEGRDNAISILELPTVLSLIHALKRMKNEWLSEWIFFTGYSNIIFLIRVPQFLSYVYNPVHAILRNIRIWTQNYLKNKWSVYKAEYHSHQREQYNRNNTKLSFYQKADAEVLIMHPDEFSSVQFSHSVVSNPLQPHGLQHPGFPVYHHLPELAHTYVHQVSDAIQTSHPLLTPSAPVINLSQHQCPFQWISSSYRWPQYWSFSFSIVLPVSIQDWFPLGWTGLISLLSKLLSRVFSNTTVQKHKNIQTHVQQHK